MATVSKLTASNGFYGYNNYSNSASNHLYVGAANSSTQYDYRSYLTFKPLSSIEGIGSNNVSISKALLYVRRNNGGSTTITVGCSTSNAWGAALIATKAATINSVSQWYSIDITNLISAIATNKSNWFLHFGGGTPELRLNGVSSDYAPYILIKWQYAAKTISSNSEEALLGSSLTFTITPEVSGETHTLTWSIGDQSGTVVTRGGNSISWTPPLSLATEFPNDEIGNVKIQMTAYNSAGAVQRTEVFYQTVKATTSMKLSFSNTGISLQNGLSGCGMTGRSYISLAPVISTSAAYGATLSRLSATITNGSIVQEFVWTTMTETSASTLTAAVQNSSLLNSTGYASVTLSAIDSRGREITTSASYTVLAYSAPQISMFSVERYEPVYDSNETITGYIASDMGGYVWVNIQASVSSIMPVSTQLNRLTWSIYGQSESGKTVTANGSGTTYVSISKNRLYISGAVDEGESWQYTLTVTDATGNTATQYSAVLPAHAALSVSPDKYGFAVGMVASGTKSASKFEVAEGYESIFYGGIRGVTNYSTAEVATGGKWIDRKPIYRKVFSNSVAIPAGQATVVPTGISSLDTIVHLEAYVKYSGSIGLLNTVGNPSNASANGTSIDIYDKTNNSLRVRRGSAYSNIAIGEAYFIMEYTKV